MKCSLDNNKPKVVRLGASAAYLYGLQRLLGLQLDAGIHVEVNVVTRIGHVDIHRGGGAALKVSTEDSRGEDGVSGVERQLRARNGRMQVAPLVLDHLAGRVGV
jgi:hypothetical protein